MRNKIKRLEKNQNRKIKETKIKEDRKETSPLS